MLEAFLAGLFSKKRQWSSTKDLSHLTPILKTLGDPHRSFSSIHIAGTNGKGSVATKIAAALSHSGRRVGLYTSPHLLRFHERIRIDQQEIADAEILEFGDRVLAASADSALPLHFFELTTLMAMLYFSERKIDVAVFEAGIGGKLDATNVLLPILCVITSISFDHMERLGTTLEAIATEKAGIIKPLVPIVLGPRANFRACIERADALHAPLHQVAAVSSLFEEENQIVAREALNVLSISKESIAYGLKAVPPCRFMRVGEMLFDVAHNEDGFIHLFSMLKHSFPQKRARLVMGLSKDKDLRAIMRIVEKEASYIHFVRAQHERATDISDFFKGEEDHRFNQEPSVIKGLQKALVRKEDDEIIVVCGSFYVVAEALASLNSFSSSCKEK